MHIDWVTSTLIHYRYWILIPLAILEGPIVAFLTGTLCAFGYFNLYVVYGLFVVKDVAVDGAYYGLGRLARKKPFVERLLTRAHIDNAAIGDVRRLWDQYGWRAMFVGKLSFGLAPVFLIVAGGVAVPVAAFFRWAAGVALLQYAVLLTVGYYGGRATARSLHSIQAIGIVAAVVAIIYIHRYVRILASPSV